MSEVIPEKYMDLFRKRAFAHLATLMPDGSPQVTPVWVMAENGLIVVNSARGRRKDKNMRRDARVALSLQDPENPYRYLEVRGTVVEITENGADDCIEALSRKYLGRPYPFRQPHEVRVIYRIKPERVTCLG